MNSLQLITSKKDYMIFFLAILLLLFLNLSYEYFKYNKLKDEEVFEDNFRVINIYDKKDFYVLKIKK